MRDGDQIDLDGRTLVLHLGAHKTATTYIQSGLIQHRDALRATGAQLILRRDFRAGAKGAGGAWRGLDSLLAEAVQGDAERITISEEGLIGAPRHVLRQGAIYEDMTARLTVLPQALNHENVHIMFAVRDYGTFLSSCYTTVLRRGRVLPRDRMRAKGLRLARRWIDVVRDIRGAWPRARLSLWRYEDFRALESRVFTEMVGYPLRVERTDVFRNLSQRAVDLLESDFAQDGELKKPRVQIRAATTKFPLSQENPPFSLWSVLESEDMRARYDADWADLCREFPDAVWSAT